MAVKKPLVTSANVSSEQLQAGDSLYAGLTATYMVYVGASGELLGTSKLVYDGTHFTLASGSALKSANTLILAPAATKPIQATIDGNTRGTAAVDFQTTRSSASQVASGNYSAILGGYYNTNAADYSFIGCGINNNILALSVQSVICSGNGNDIAASCTYSFIGTGYDCNVSGSNGNSIVCSSQTNLTGAWNGVLSGITHTITASYSNICGGYINSVTGDYSGILHGANCSVSSNYASASGKEAISSRYGQRSQASGKFSIVGDAQISVFTLRGHTTDDTAAELFLDGSSARLTIPESTSWLFIIKCVARQTDDDHTVHVYHYSGCITRESSGNATILGTPGALYEYITDFGWSFAIIADTSNQSLKIGVQGGATDDILWVAKVELIEVTG